MTHRIGLIVLIEKAHESIPVTRLILRGCGFAHRHQTSSAEAYIINFYINI